MYLNVDSILSNGENEKESGKFLKPQIEKDWEKYCHKILLKLKKCLLLILPLSSCLEFYCGRICVCGGGAERGRSRTDFWVSRSFPLEAKKLENFYIYANFFLKILKNSLFNC